MSNDFSEEFDSIMELQNFHLPLDAELKLVVHQEFGRRPRHILTL